MLIGTSILAWILPKPHHQLGLPNPGPSSLATCPQGWCPPKVLSSLFTLTTVFVLEPHMWKGLVKLTRL